MDIWGKCRGEKNITIISDTAWRIVESQEKLSTRKLVDSLEEQEILDRLLEESKSHIHPSTTKFHPLLYTPFRYPPLKYVSRFGTKTEPALWYGSLNLTTAITEKAFQQFSFLNASNAELGRVTNLYSIFSVNLNIKKGIQLNKNPFLKYKKSISSPIDYTASQLLGAKMRNHKIDGFTFISARDPQEGINVGLFNTNAFASKNPHAHSFQTWQCIANKEKMEFRKISCMQDTTIPFSIQTFLIDNHFPFL